MTTVATTDAPRRAPIPAIDQAEQLLRFDRLQRATGLPVIALLELAGYLDGDLDEFPTLFVQIITRQEAPR